jgi:hypothetical protein
VASEETKRMELPGRSTWDGNVGVGIEIRGDPNRDRVSITALEHDEPSRIIDVRLEGATFHNVNLSGAQFSETVLGDVELWAWGRNLTAPIGLRINGVDVAPLVDAELDRRFPERLVLRDIADVAGLRRAADVVSEMWQPTIERARALDAQVLNTRVNLGYSFLETLRHLVFGFDAWVRRTAFREPRPFHAIALGFPDDTGTWSPAGKVPWSTVGIDITADPTLDEVLAVRAENDAYLLGALDRLADDDLAKVHDAIVEPGYPSGDHSRRSIGDCLRGRFNEEWWHHQYAMRDLAVLER